MCFFPVQLGRSGAAFLFGAERERMDKSFRRPLVDTFFSRHEERRQNS